MAVTDIPLRDYFEKVLEQQLRTHETALRSTEKTLEATAKSLEIRLHSMNEFRAVYEDRIRAIEKHAANLDGRLWALGVGLTVLTLVINVALRYIQP